MGEPNEVEVVADAEAEDEARSAINEPAKLMRIALMLREMQEEVRRAPPDQAGRERLRVVHERAVRAMCDVLSEDLQEEFSELALPFGEGTPTESEILIAQAQLIGWLEGLFQGIQAAIFNQQLAARRQLEQLRQRGLPPGMAPFGQRATPEGPQPGTGQYL
ncbi:MAG TPA: proteasome activator [Egibacteraceae bacterium]|nr:bacterial proteasome activator family protein [Actinomycetota bacterium]HWB70980.1 proteasome activator [Egibacteraceae bacterium]